MKKLLYLFMFIFLAICFLVFENNSLAVSRLNIQSEKIPSEFDGYTIVHLSDLHSKYFGRNQQYLVSLIKKAQPDLIAVTGDMVDSNRYDETPFLNLLDQLKDTAPIYFTAGNHEIGSRKFESFKNKISDYGVKVLRGDADRITIKKSSIYIAGIDDPIGHRENTFIEDELDKIVSVISEKYFTVLLSHRPEKFSIYGSYKIDLTLSGHAHGGQVRIPFTGGLYAPGQGFWPKYTSGIYENGMSYMIVNRGLGNSIIPQRIFNRPEIVIITLSTK